MKTQEEGSVKSTSKDGVTTIEFSHPRANSLPQVLLKKMKSEFASVAADQKVVLLRSGGDKSFCAGASFDEFKGLDTQDKAEEFFFGFGSLVLSILRCPVPVVCRVQGKAVGGALGIIAACDYVCAESQASVRLSELSIGIGPFVIEPAVTRKIGVAAMSELALDREWKPASWAASRGLYQRVVSGEEELENSSLEIARSLTQPGSLALKELKSALRGELEFDEAYLEKRAKTSATLLMQDETQKLLASL